jgi:hypothetical protein
MLRRHVGQYGLSFEEEIEMAYNNLQQEAKGAIAGRRRPSEQRKNRVSESRQNREEKR